MRQNSAFCHASVLPYITAQVWKLSFGEVSGHSQVAWRYLPLLMVYCWLTCADLRGSCKGLKPPKTPEVCHDPQNYTLQCELHKSYLHGLGKVSVHSHLNLTTYKPSRCCFVSFPHPWWIKTETITLTNRLWGCNNQFLWQGPTGHDYRPFYSYSFSFFFLFLSISISIYFSTSQFLLNKNLYYRL